MTTRKTSRANAALTVAMALAIVGHVRFVTAEPGDIFQSSAPVIGSDPPKAAAVQHGDASVSAQTGALRYSYPIAVPPGRHGLAPQLSLAYSSQAPIYGGLAAGWSLPIPLITLDTSLGRLASGAKRYKSSLAGDRPLVVVSEPAPGDVAATYRAQNDSTFQRYQRALPAAGFAWRVLTSDGLIHTFGDRDHTTNCTIVSDEYAPLTRTVDAFGNAVDYFYQAGVANECRIASIVWGHNVRNNAHAVAAFASVLFSYNPNPPACHSTTPGATSALPIGSQSSYRTGRQIVTGASELNTLTVTVFAPGQPSAVDHTRVITLDYDRSDAGNCSAGHAAYRALASIQEIASGAHSPRVSLPAVLFRYGPSLVYPASTIAQTPWFTQAIGETADLARNLSWGYRPADRWPTVEAMLVDLDGDGRVDRLTNDPILRDGHVVACGARWQRNVGNMRFDEPMPIALPTLKWGTATGSRYNGGEWANQHSNVTNETCALNYQLSTYVNGSGHGMNAACGGLDTAGTCIDGICSNNGADCEPRAPTANYTTLAYRWIDIDGDGLTDLIASPAQGGYGLYDLQWGRGFKAPPEPALFGAFPPCPARQPPVYPFGWGYTMCGGLYPWFIYRNHGRATFGTHGLPDAIKYQPVPLESSTGDSSIIGTTVSQNQGMVDVDGDGFLDAIAGAGSEWSVYRNDGTGQLLPAVGTWLGATGDTLARSACPPGSGICSPLLGVAGLFDANGDGLVDQWNQVGTGPLANVEFNDGTRFRAPGDTGELQLSVRPATDAFMQVLSGGSVGIGSPRANPRSWIDSGYRNDITRAIDLDGDGRPDVWTSVGTPPTTIFNQGGQFAGTALMGDAQALAHWMVASISSGKRTWEVRSDMVDLDGDGIPEGVFAGTDGVTDSLQISRIATPTQPPRLLVQIDNQRGAITNVAYASLNSAIVTRTDTSYMPRTGWVVSSLSTLDSIANTTTASSFRYESPRYLPDDRGQFGFRGFDLVETTLPSGAVKADRYSYTPDWSGRLSQTAMRPAEAPAEARTIDRTTWVAKGLFCDAGNANCAITTYHAIATDHLICANGTAEAQCTPFTAAGYTRTDTLWSPCASTMSGGPCDAAAVQTPGALLWIPTDSTLQRGTALIDGDRRTSTSYAVWSDGSTYRVRPLMTTNEVWKPGGFEVYGRTATEWNRDSGLEYSLPVADLVWFNNSSPTCTATTSSCAVTRRRYDLETGNLVERWKPMQNSADGPSTTYEYDSRKLFVTAEQTEPGGHLKIPKRFTYVYDYGTGTKLATIGPNIASCSGPPPYATSTSICPEGTTHLQSRRIEVDGLGRTLSRWETYADPDHPDYYIELERERNSYVDAMPSSIATQTAIDLPQHSLSGSAARPGRAGTIDVAFATVGVRFATSKVELDGHGRPIKKTVFAQGAAVADQVSTFAYANDGTLRAVTAPDPAANDSPGFAGVRSTPDQGVRRSIDASAVTYTYAFDSLGRPTSLRRPDSTNSASQSGTTLAYNGLSTTVSEGVGEAGGQGAVTVSTKDPFGRLIKVEEQVAANSYATTTYRYDAADNVIEIVDPAGGTTAMTHDFAGRRTQLTRGGRTWTYTYDKNGNQIAETFPGSTAAIQPDIDFTNTTTYDDTDAPIGTLIGQRTLSAEDSETFGAAYERYIWEVGPSSVGRLSFVESYAPSGALTTASRYLYDLDGRETSTHQTFRDLPSQSRQTARSYTLAGGTRTTSYFDYPTTASHATWSTIRYDNRGYPAEIDLRLSPTAAINTVGENTRNVAGLVTTRRTRDSGPMKFIESNWTYDSLGRVTSQVVQHGPDRVQVARQDLAYFGNDDVKTLDHWLGATHHTQFRYGYDARHQLTRVDETVLPNAFTASYAYNAAGRLTSVQEAAATLPHSDVRPRNVTYEYRGNDPEQVTGLVDAKEGGIAWAYTYDAAGNQTMRCSGPIATGSGSCTGSDATEYVYDGNDRLRRATRKRDGAVQGSEEYWYDGRGNRNIVVKRNASGAKTETIWFINDVEAHYDGAGQWIRSYAHVSMGTPVARVATGTSLVGEVEYQFHGLANNTLAAVSANGTVQASFSYAPFGEIIEATSAGGATTGLNAHRRRMNDKFVDEVSDLAYYGARYYDKTSMTWTQCDPRYRVAPDAAGTTPRRASLYAFSLNNPLRYLDPDGMETRHIEAVGQQVVEAALSVAPLETALLMPAALRAVVESHDFDRFSAGTPSCACLGERFKNGATAVANAVGEAPHSVIGFFNALDDGPNRAAPPPSPQQFASFQEFAQSSAATDALFRRLPGSKASESVGAAEGAARGGASVVRAGQAGEAAVRSVADIGPKVPITVAGRGRIPDGLNLEARVLSEVKNVSSLSYTRQLRDFAAHARANGLRFDLWVRPDTELSGPLAREVANKAINLRYIP